MSHCRAGGARHSARLACAALAIALAMPAAHAGPHDADASPIVFVGLLPRSGPDGAGDLVGLRLAQQLRVAIEASLADLSNEQVVGHDALTARLGKRYLPKWFDCASSVKCLVRLLAPLRDLGGSVAITGDYYTAGDAYHVRMIEFSVADGKVAAEIRFDIATASGGDKAAWTDKLRPLLANRLGRIHLASNVADTTCTLDGKPCSFEPDGVTIATTPGDHPLVLGKDGYVPKSVVVTVETGTTQEVAIELASKTAGRVVVAAGHPRLAPSLTAVRTDKIIQIDGKLDEPAWRKAWIETNFTQNFPDESKQPTERTELRVLYDDDSIYVGIRCFDSHPDEIVSRLTRRDRDIQADKVTVDIDSRNDHQSSYTFQVNAANVQLDGTRFNDTDSSTDWDGIWDSATSRDDKGWTAELRIPLATLRYAGDTTSFGFQVRRYITRRQEVDEWAYVPRNVQGEVSYYGTLEGLDDLHAQRLLQITPYDSHTVTFRTRQGPLDGHVYGDKLGADLKLGITPGLSLDGTINPDFGTVEVDQVVLNLSRFETYYPEKRPFFLEGADLFATPFQLFYSRRIGRNPPDNAISSNLVEPAPDGQIYGAAKVSGLLADRLQVGLIDAVTAREDETFTRTAGASPESTLVDPLTNFAIVRLRQDFAKNSFVGLLGTAVDRFEPANAAAPMPGDACPLPHAGLQAVGAPVGGRCTNDAYTGGVDSVLRTSDGEWGASAQLVGSLLENGPDRVQPDGTIIKPGALGWGLTTEAGKYGGEHFLAVSHVDYVTPNLEINDAGFSPNAMESTAPGPNDLLLQQYFTLRTTKPFLWFQNSSLRLNLKYRAYSDSGKLGPSGGTGTGAYLQFLATFPNFWTLSLNGGPNAPQYNNRETTDGALLQSPLTYNYAAEVTTDPREHVIGDLFVGGTTTARGTGTSATLTVNLRPATFFELDMISDGYWSFGDPRWVDTVANPDGTRTYYFQDLDSREWDVLLRATVTLSPRLSLQTYAQLYLDGGHYGKVTAASGSGARPLLDFDTFSPATLPDAIDDDFRDSAVNINAFLRWEYRPGSLLWLGYTRNQLNPTYDPTSDGNGHLEFRRIFGPSTDTLLIKLSYMWEPLRRR